MLPPIETPVSSTGFKDRRAGLVIFGILTALMGGLFGLFASLIFFGQAVSARTGAPQSARAIVPAIMIYGVVAVVLVWLGVGSIMAKRWARALLLIFSWSGLITGVLALGMMVFMLPHIMDAVKAGAPAGKPELRPRRLQPSL
jgi:hypothetical protein